MTLPRSATQFNGTSAAPPKDIVIGLDFGTSCTKVVLQDPPSRVAYAVPFGDLGNPTNPFLLSSKLGLRADGRCRLVGFKQSGMRGIKRMLMQRPLRFFRMGSEPTIETSALTLASCYVALVLQHVRGWFLENLLDEYGANKIRWYLNLGIPARNYDEKKVRLAFLAAARIGWWLSLEEDVSIEAARLLVSGSRKNSLLGDPFNDLIQVVPEVAAEVASYARSSLRQFGLHLIVDVGASTTDVAAFRLEAAMGEFEYWFLWAEISELACYSLHRCRVRKVEEGIGDWLKRLRAIDEIEMKIPQSHGEYFPPEISLSEVDKGFVDAITQPITKTFWVIHQKKDPHASEFRSGIPLFLCGGGSELGIFKDTLIEKAEERLRNYEWAGFKMRSLPKPDELRADGLPSRDFHRLAVAYGLSFFFDDIGRIVPPSEIDDVPRQERIRIKEYISKDLV